MYPTLRFQIGAAEYNHSIFIEPEYYLKSFSANSSEFDGTCQLLLRQQDGKDSQWDWSLGNILFEKYAIWFDENAQFIAIAGEDIICNQFQQVYFSLEDRENGLGP